MPAMDGDNFETDPDESEGLQNIEHTVTDQSPFTNRYQICLLAIYLAIY
jgi:hypothetical protein